MERATGMELFDVEGRRYLDFIGGWAVDCLGHSPRALAAGLAEQASRLVNASPSLWNRPQVELAERLTALTGLDKVWFGSTGSEANEGAIKLARKWGAVLPFDDPDALRAAVTDRTAEVMIELVQGPSPPQPNTCVACGRCATSDACSLIFHEVQTGYGLFAFQRYGVRPDS